MPTILSADKQFQLNTLRQMAAEGYLYGEIAAAIGITIKQLYWLRYMYGRDVKVTRDPKAQQTAARRAFDDATALEIYKLKNTGIAQIAVAERYGVCTNVVGNIWKHRTYKEVTKRWRNL